MNARPNRPSFLPTGPRCSGGASSLLRMGLGGMPQRFTQAPRLAAVRPFCLRQRMPSTQLDLFGPPGILG